MEVFRSHRLPRWPEIYCNFRQQVKWAKNAAGFPGILKSPEHRSCKAIDKERAWLDRIGLSDVSFSVANKLNRRINRERKGNNLSIVVHSGLTAYTLSKEGRQAGVPSQGLEAQSPSPTGVPGFTGSLKLGIALWLALFKKKNTKNHECKWPVACREDALRASAQVRLPFLLCWWGSFCWDGIPISLGPQVTEVSRVPCGLHVQGERDVSLGCTKWLKLWGWSSWQLNLPDLIDSSDLLSVWSQASLSEHQNQEKGYTRVVNCEFKNLVDQLSESSACPAASEMCNFF